jgi:hypothetical protein
MIVFVRAWSRNLTPDGLISAMVGPSALSALAAALDPRAPYVRLGCHAPLAGRGWTPVSLPLTGASASTRPIRVASLRYDALFDTQDFLHAVDQLDEYGADVAQFDRLPRVDVSFDDPRPHVRAARYRAFGLRVRIDLPHRNEVANIITLDEVSMQEALTRLGAT